MAKVLLADDQNHVLDTLELLFEMRGGLETVRAQSVAEALAHVQTGEVGVVVHDMNFSEGTTSGAEGRVLFDGIRQIDPAMPVILITAWASLEVAVDLVKRGADDYLQKPWDDARLLRKVQNLMRSREQSRNSPMDPAESLALCGLLFQSAPMHALVSLAGKVAPSQLPVLVTGPNGSGKEKVAEIVHANSSRKDAPFIKVNVGALPDELFAAEIFGAERGAFTGATSRRIGRFEAASGGTLFLDEIGNLSLGGQAKLLRALQTGEFERLGSSQTQKADVRVIAATNLDMAQAIAKGDFREDLYYRLAVIELNVPPLSERAEDIPHLAQAFADHYCDGLATGETGAGPLTPGFISALQNHPWPGNVRELQNRMQRALLMADGGPLLAEFLGLQDAPVAKTLESGQAPAVEHSGTTAASSYPSAPPGLASSPGQGEPEAGKARSPLEAAERETIEKALLAADYVVSRAAESLGLSRQALYRRMQRLGLRVRRDVS